MAELLIVETGLGLDDANCYGITDPDTTRAAARAYALARGVTLPADDDALSALIVLATDYLGSKESQYFGERVTSSQALAWPRKCIIDSTTGLPFPSDVLPQALLNAMYQLCIEQNNGVNLLPTTDNASSGGFVIEERVDVLSTRYSERIGTNKLPLLPAVESILAQITNNSGGIRSVRL